MKRHLKVSVCAAALAGLLAPIASGATLIDDTFSYPDGGLVGKDPAIGGVWGTHSGTTGPIQVSGGQISVVQASGFTEDVNLPFEGAVTAGAGMPKLYSAFDLMIADPGAAVSTTMFAHFLASTTQFTSRVYVTAPTTSGYRLALSNDNSITDADGEAFSDDLSFGTTYRIVTEYNFDDQNVSRLWIDPVNGNSPSIMATDPGFANAVGAYAFRQAGGNTTQVVDNLIVSSDPSEVGVPEPGSLALLGIGGLMALRRRR